MKVLFLKAVEPYRVGQVADVAEGYAQNFLLPQKLAIPATAHAIQEAQRRQQQHVAAVAGADHDLDALAQVLIGATVRVTAKASPTGTLYAAVTPVQIAEAVATQTGYHFPKALQKQLPTLKHVGPHPVTLQIHATTVTFTLDV